MVKRYAFLHRHFNGVYAGLGIQPVTAQIYPPQNFQLLVDSGIIFYSWEGFGPGLGWHLYLLRMYWSNGNQVYKLIRREPPAAVHRHFRRILWLTYNPEPG